MDKEDALNFLLYFCQSFIPYKDDFDGFGNDKTLSPEETLFYNGGDCEDKSILFSISNYNIGKRYNFEGIPYVVAEPTSDIPITLGISTHSNPKKIIPMFFD